MKLKNQYKLIVFDWDGTLMDSIGKIVVSMQAAAKKLNLQVPTVNEVKAVIGYSMHEALIRVFPKQNSEIISSLTKEYRRYYIELTQIPSPLFDGVEDLLEQLKSDGYLLAIATGKTRSGLDKVLDETGLGHYFITTRCADETQSKPHPQMLLEIMDELEVPVNQVLMVGDSKMDLTMASNASVDSIAVSCGAHSIDSLKLAKPKAIINKPDELYALLMA